MTIKTSEPPATTALEVAASFTRLLKENDHAAAAATYNADNIVSIEPFDGPMWLCCGKEEVRRKCEQWRESYQIHSSHVEGPYVNGDEFIVRFKMDVTSMATGRRMTIDEVGLYVVAHGKIVTETFCSLRIDQRLAYVTPAETRFSGPMYW